MLQGCDGAERVAVIGRLIEIDLIFFSYFVVRMLIMQFPISSKNAISLTKSENNFVFIRNISYILNGHKGLMFSELRLIIQQERKCCPSTN